MAPGINPHVTATYAYNNAGDLYTVTYNDGTTPGVTYTYDRRGRQKTVVCNGITTTLTFNDANQPLTESYAGGTLGGLTVTSGYDTFLRRTTLSLNTTPTSLSYAYAYDTASRLTNVTEGTYGAGYGYLANSPLVSQITFKQSSTVRLTTTKQFDLLNRLQSISSVPSPSASLPLTYAYQYNDANQRTRMTLTDGSFWIYVYDALGQVVSGKRYWSDNTPVPGQQNEYTFDDIGNRSSTKSGGDQNGVSLRSASYTANRINQYSSRTVPGGFDVVGIAPAGTNVTVNSSSPDYRRSEYFQEPITVVNTSVPVWQSVSVTTGGGGSASGNVWTPKTPENYGYDLDGNTTSDGRWTYAWDAENRLTRLVANTAVGPQQRLDFEYDSQGRRIRKKVWNNTGGTGTPAIDLKFLYDGWNLTAELDANAGSNLKRSYVWGLDLSGSEQGAGGVGGLLLVKPASGNPLFVAYDGNGNVTGLIDATTGTTSAQYEYGPFGETIRLSGTGTVAKDNPLRFSTKYQDGESDLLYYGYRYYAPTTGRWISRDPLGEQVGFNVSAFAGNDVINSQDFLGLYIELWYGNHPVASIANHSKLWLITDEASFANAGGFEFHPALSKIESAPAGFIGPCNIWLIAIGAGPGGRTGLELVANFNRESDIEESLHNPTLVAGFSTESQARAFLGHVAARNRRMNLNFENTTLEYWFNPPLSYTDPDGWDEFNSNSYISGLLASFGYTLPQPGAYVPGYEKPVPSFVFTKLFPSTRALKKEWKLHYPGF
ncbi:MAG: RHS repeat-associated core domain-containing protein [Verrucomicrobia bacterium]|nr:RHS repeat-associated core domain-containing protein [Verrucomicrobiota bacterium]